MGLKKHSFSTLKGSTITDVEKSNDSCTVTLTDTCGCVFQIKSQYPMHITTTNTAALRCVDRVPVELPTHNHDIEFVRQNERYSHDEITKRVRDVISNQLGIDPHHVKSDCRLIADFGADSLDLVEMVMYIEDEFSIEIDDSDAEDMCLRPVAGIVDLLYIRLNTKLYS